MGAGRRTQEGTSLQVSPEGFLLSQGATDSEKRVQHLTLENKALKQSLSLTRDLLLHWGPAPNTRAPQVSCFLAETILAAWGSPTTALQQHCPCFLRTHALTLQTWAQTVGSKCVAALFRRRTLGPSWCSWG